MLNVFHLISDLGPGGAAKQLGLLAPVLPRDKFRVEVGVLGPAGGPAADALREASVPVRPFRVRHLFDVSALRKVRAAVAAHRPAVVHAWDPPALRTSRFVLAAHPDDGAVPRLVASGCSALGGGAAGWFAAWRLRRADRVLPVSRAEGERYQRHGVGVELLTRVVPAIGPAPDPADRMAFRTAIGVPPDAPLVFAGGRLDGASGLKDAVWAFDMVRHEDPSMHLVVFGDGPDRGRLEELARSLGRDDYRVRFVGPRPDLPALTGLAAVVWVTQATGGTNLALEAMAAGRPVVGFENGDLREVVLDGETGFLVPPGDRNRLAARTRALFDDSALAGKLGAAGRERAATHFGVARAAEQLARVYREVAGV
jgi:glycosyltransferase involved in cell wall biosynthesis